MERRYAHWENMPIFLLHDIGEALSSSTVNDHSYGPHGNGFVRTSDGPKHKYAFSHCYTAIHPHPPVSVFPAPILHFSLL